MNSVSTVRQEIEAVVQRFVTLANTGSLEAFADLYTVVPEDKAEARAWEAAGAPLVYIGATVPRPQLEAVLVPKGSAIRSVADCDCSKRALTSASSTALCKRTGRLAGQ